MHVLKMFQLLFVKIVGGLIKKFYHINKQCVPLTGLRIGSDGEGGGWMATGGAAVISETGAEGGGIRVRAPTSRLLMARLVVSTWIDIWILVVFVVCECFFLLLFFSAMLLKDI
jgi:hypothetical protein